MVVKFLAKQLQRKLAGATLLQTNENQNTKTREPRQDDAWPSNDKACPTERWHGAIQRNHDSRAGSRAVETNLSGRIFAADTKAC